MLNSAIVLTVYCCAVEAPKTEVDMLDEPIVTLPLTAIVGVSAGCEEPLFVREIEMTVLALFGTV